MPKKVLSLIFAVLMGASFAKAQTAEVTVSLNEQFFDALLDAIFKKLSAQLAAAPKGFTHRDYQSRNLMVKGDELIVIELKKGFSTDLLIQATDRQRVTDSVYVALPAEGDLARRDR